MQNEGVLLSLRQQDLKTRGVLSRVRTICRNLAIFLCWVLASAATGPSSLDAFEATAVARAVADIERMPPGRQREHSAFLLSSFLLRRAQCERALPIISRELVAEAVPGELGTLAHDAAKARDVRCLMWMGTHIDKVIRGSGLGEPERSILRAREAMIFNLAGRDDRAPLTLPALDPNLDFVRKELSDVTLHVGRATIEMIGVVGRPTVREELLLEQLDAYRGTRLFSRLLHELVKLAPHHPKLLTPSGWRELALDFLSLGDESTARAVVRDRVEKLYTFEGVEAEFALLEHRYAEAAELMADDGEPQHDEQIQRITEEEPRALLPHLHDAGFWGEAPVDAMEISNLSDALDRVGASAAAEEAAREVLRRIKKKGHEEMRNLKMKEEARLGHLAQAKRELHAVRNKSEERNIANIILFGLASRGDRREFAAFVAELPPWQRPWLLGELITANVRIPRDLRDSAAAEVADFLRRHPKQVISAAWMDELGWVGVSPAGLIAILRTAPDAATRGALAVAAAQGAGDGGRKGTAIALADEARRQFGQKNIPDGALSLLTRIYWVSGRGELAINLPKLIRDSATRVLAWTQIVRSKADVDKVEHGFVFSPLSLPPELVGRRRSPSTDSGIHRLHGGPKREDAKR